MIVNNKILESAMSQEEWYAYYRLTLSNGIYSLGDLKQKRCDYESHKDGWERASKESLAGARDFESFLNAQTALEKIISEEECMLKTEEREA